MTSRRLATLLLIVLAASSSAQAAGIPFHDPIYGTLRTPDLVYGTSKINGGSTNFDLKLDWYQPTENGVPLATSAPGLVLIHGGSFTGGDKFDSVMKVLAPLYATYGYSVVSINYRLGGQNPPLESGPWIQPGANIVNAAYQDSVKAMNWVRDHAADLHMDPNRIGIGGVSAGAITSLFEAYWNPQPHSTPSVVLDFLGSMYGAEVGIPPGVPPAFVVHGTGDPTVPFSGDQAVVAKLTSLGVYNEFYVYPGGGHTFDFNTIFGSETLLQHNLQFLSRFLLAPEPSSLMLAAIGSLALVMVARRRSGS